jgi:hypothetical protein
MEESVDEWWDSKNIAVEEFGNKNKKEVPFPGKSPYLKYPW